MAKIIAHGTHGKEDPERATLPFIVGNVAATADQEAAGAAHHRGRADCDEGLR